MSSKEVEVTCPCCTARLTVDVRTGQVLKRQLPVKEGTEGRAEPQVLAQQRRVGGLDRDLRAAAQRQPGPGGSQRGRVVDPVADEEHAAPPRERLGLLLRRELAARRADAELARRALHGRAVV